MFFLLFPLAYALAFPLATARKREHSSNFAKIPEFAKILRKLSELVSFAMALTVTL